MQIIKNVLESLLLPACLLIAACSSSASGTSVGGDEPLNIPAPVSHLTISSPDADGSVRFTTRDAFADPGTTVTVTTTSSTSADLKYTSSSPLYATASVVADADGSCQIELAGDIGDSVTISYTLDGVDSETSSTVPEKVPPLPLAPTLLDVSIDPTLDMAMILAGDGSDGVVYVMQLSDGTITETVELSGASGIAKITTDPRTGYFYAIDAVNDALWEINANTFATEEVAVDNLSDIAAGESGNFEILAHASGAAGSSYYDPFDNTPTLVPISVASGATHVQSPLVATDFITATGIDVYALVSEMDDGDFYVARYEVQDSSLITQSPANAVALTGISNPGGLFVFNEGAEALVTNRDDDTVYRVNLTTGVMVAITVGDDPRDVVVDTTADFAYVLNSVDDTVTAIQLSDNTVAATSRTGLVPIAAAIDDTLIVLHTGDQTAALYE